MNNLERPDCYLTNREVAKLLRVTTNGLRYIRQNSPDFPKPIKLTPTPQGRIRFREKQVHDWLDSRPQDHDGVSH